MPGGGPAAGRALDHDRAGVAEEPGEAGAGGDRDDPAAGRAASARLRGGLDLLGEVGDPDPVRPAGGDAGLDRGADVVDVDVDVPQPLAADHDERVAERRQVALERSTAAGVVGVEEVHHLVRRAARAPGRRPAPRSRDGIGAGAERRGHAAIRPPAGEHRLGRVEDHAQPAAAGVDDARRRAAAGAARACGRAPRGRPRRPR